VRDDAPGFDDQVLSQQFGNPLSGTWIVTGTTASVGDHSIITGERRSPQSRSVHSGRYSV
jgi:hypothetical protein